MILQKSTDIKTSYFYDENKDLAYVDVMYEKHIINPNGLIQLQNIPSPLHTVFDVKGKDGTTVIKYSNVEVISNKYDFTVDYINGILTFHNSQVGKEIKVSYTNSIGKLNISSDRIFTNIDNQGNVVQTLGTLLEEGKQTLSDLDKRVDNAYKNLYIPSYSKKSIDIVNMNYSKILTLYDELLLKYPNYITKTLLGKDSSNTIDIYKYDFSISNYNNWIVIDANIHGDDSYGDAKDISIGLYYFLNDLCENYNKNDKLSYIRCNFNLSVIPVANPWGYNNNSRFNSNNIDLNRNFDVFWTASSDSGNSPFSEVESRYIRDNLFKINLKCKNLSNKIIAYLPLHNYSSSRLEKPSYPYSVSNTSPMISVFQSVSNLLCEKYNYTTTGSVVVASRSSADNYAERKLGIPSGTNEFVINRNDGQTRTGFAMFQLVEYIGNLIYKSTELVASKLKYSLYNVVKSVNIPYANNEVIKDIEEKNTENVFDFDSATGDITIPSGVDYIRFNISLNLFIDNTSEEKFGIRFQLLKNGSTNYNGFSYTDDYIVLGGASSFMQYKTIKITSPNIYVNEGDKFSLSIRKTSTNKSVVITTSSFISVEEVKRFK